MVAAMKITVFGHVMRCNFIDQYLLPLSSGKS